ncbi:MAG: single-stranded DNA binding protein [Halodesulfurarchaeum sp.]|nr:single-stranded DNA binding protein [Halodesulfurarchaeum sp.]
MGDIETIYEDLDTEEVSLEEFREAVVSKVEQMGGLADEETAAMLLAHELDDGQVEGVADVEPGMEEVAITAKVLSVGELRTFERDDPDQPDGQVLNADVADETGRLRVSFWDEMASSADSELEEGQVLNLKGRPKEGYDGVELSVDRVEPDPDTEIEVDLTDEYRVADLGLGASDVNLIGEVLATEPVRTFDRDDGSEGKVSNLLVGDETGRVRVTLWDEQADRTEDFTAHDTVEVIDGYVRERDGSLELHLGDRGAIGESDAEVGYVPDATPIEAVELDETVDIAGVVRSADPKRTFDRDDGTEGQVRNVRVQDETDDIRVALWGEKADLELGPGDEVLFVDVAIQDGWQDDLEASANWQTTVVPLEDGIDTDLDSGEDVSDTGLSAFGDVDGDSAGAESTSATGLEDGPTSEPSPGPEAVDPKSETADPESVEFTGVVVQAGNPIILDDGEQTVTIQSDLDVELGEELTVAGQLTEGILDPERVETDGKD